MTTHFHDAVLSRRRPIALSQVQRRALLKIWNHAEGIDLDDLAYYLYNRLDRLHTRRVVLNLAAKKLVTLETRRVEVVVITVAGRDRVALLDAAENPRLLLIAEAQAGEAR